MNEFAAMAFMWVGSSGVVKLPFHWIPFGMCLILLHYVVLFLWAYVRMLYGYAGCDRWSKDYGHQAHALPSFRTFSHTTRDEVGDFL
jgi:hypothetical protein